MTPSRSRRALLLLAPFVIVACAAGRSAVVRPDPGAARTEATVEAVAPVWSFLARPTGPDLRGSRESLPLAPAPATAPILHAGSLIGVWDGPDAGPRVGPMPFGVSGRAPPT